MNRKLKRKVIAVDFLERTRLSLIADVSSDRTKAGIPRFVVSWLPRQNCVVYLIM